jgi:hypothetical protein
MDTNDDGGSAIELRFRESPNWGRAFVGEDFGIRVRVKKGT